MSGALTLLQSVLITPSRGLIAESGAILYPDCAVEERGIDTLEITRQPVEYGANIADHAFKNPATVTLRWAWSNSSIANALASGLGPLGIFGFGSEDYCRKVYESILALQASRVPFSIMTGKRLYESMLMASITVATNEETEYALFLEVECQEVIIVNTQAATLPPQSAQANPTQTSPEQNQGTQQPVPQTPAKSQSILSSAAGAVTNYLKGY